MTSGSIGPRGALTLRRLRPWPAAPTTRAIWGHVLPRPSLPAEVNLWRLRNLRHAWRGLWRLTLARALGLPHVHGTLWLRRQHPDGRVDELGIASLRVVTTAGAGYLVDAFQNIVELEEMKFHGYGSGAAAEAVGDTILQTEYTTQYPTDNIRPTGSQTENGAAVYRTVGTFDPDADVAVTEHGIFSDVDRGQGVLLDRSVFSAVNLTGATGDALQTTYDFTVNTGG